jgi:hypothetical protein
VVTVNSKEKPFGMFQRYCLWKFFLISLLMNCSICMSVCVCFQMYECAYTCHVTGRHLAFMLNQSHENLTVMIAALTV